MSNISKKNLPIKKIISGGQTGVDRAALDVAIALKIPHGGWCPKNRKAEDGAIPLHYHLQETPSTDYAERTRRNVHDADGTLIMIQNPPTGGTLLTINTAKELNKDYLTASGQGKRDLPDPDGLDQLQRAQLNAKKPGFSRLHRDPYSDD